MGQIEHAGVTISGMHGLGGIGKTALALVLADRLKERYGDAQFFLDLRGTQKDNALTAADAMKHVLRAYHPEQRLPEDESELAGLYRSVLEGRRALLLMDNAAGPQQVEPLIPPQTCLLLVTSRQHFTLPGLYAKDLDTLPPDDARRLLLEIAERICDHADEIARLCGYLPLALRLAGSALGAHRDLSPGEYVERLRDASERLRTLDRLAADAAPGIEASLSLSEALLPDAPEAGGRGSGRAGGLRQLWYALAVFPGDFDRPAAAAVWDIALPEAHDALSELVRYSVVEWNGTIERYHLHDLVRLYGDARVTGDTRSDARRRHAEHYCTVIAAAQRAYLQGGENVLRGLGLFDHEWANIQAGFAWAKAQWEQDDTAARLCSAYPDAGVYCLALRRHPRERIAWLEVAVAAARRLKDRGAEGGHLGNLGLAYTALGEPRRAIEFYEEALTIMREIGDRRAEGNILGNLGIAYANLGEVRRAIELYEQQLKITQEIGDRRGEGNALGNLGIAYKDLGEPRRAIEFYERRLVIAREIGDRRGEGNALGNLGIAYKDLGEPRRAIEFYERRLAIAREIGDRRGEGNALGNLGVAYKDLGEPRRAIEFYEQQLKITRQIGDRRGEGAALGNLGLAYADLGDPRRAIEFYEQQLKITREIGDRAGEARVNWNLGRIYAEQGDVKRAVELMQVCVDYEREIGHPEAEKHAAWVEELRQGAETPKSRKSKVESRKSKVESRKPKAESRKSKVESRKSKVESRKPKAESRKPKAER